MNISPHFKRSEFSCRCGCGFAAADIELVAVLEDLREAFDAPVYIRSGCRCPAHNFAVAGSKKSYHMRGMAADITTGARPDEVYEYLAGKYKDCYGIGSYKTFTHIDVRSVATRWKG